MPVNIYIIHIYWHPLPSEKGIHSKGLKMVCGTHTIAVGRHAVALVMVLEQREVRASAQPTRAQPPRRPRWLATHHLGPSRLGDGFGRGHPAERPAPGRRATPSPRPPTCVDRSGFKA